jgi:predicted nucleic acid-binding protein
MTFLLDTTAQKVLDENDLWIAATALATGATLITRDGDFQQIEGLSVQDWTA